MIHMVSNLRSRDLFLWMFVVSFSVMSLMFHCFTGRFEVTKRVDFRVRQSTVLLRHDEAYRR